jgi:hypothetical protein
MHCWIQVSCRTVIICILHRIGMMHLYVPALLDLAKAEAYFIKSAECIMEESDPQAKRLISAIARHGQSWHD